MVFDDIEVGLRVKTDTAELRAAIKDFDGTTESIERLKNATRDVKTNIDEQRKAIRALQQAENVRNFQLIETMRLVSAFTTLFRGLGEVYKLVQLQQINQNTATLAQLQSFDKLQRKIQDFIGMETALGGTNEQVREAFDEIVRLADNLPAEKLREFIKDFQTAISKLPIDQQIQFNDELERLNKLLKEIEIKESQKQFEDLFGTLTTLGIAAGSLGTFALQIARHGAALRGLLSLIARFKPEITILIVLLFGPKAAEALGLMPRLAGGGGTDVLNPDFSTRSISDLPTPQSRFAEGPLKERLQQIKVEMNNVTINSQADAVQVANTIARKLAEEKSARQR